MQIITLTTDFGLSDHYVAAMKGVVCAIQPECKIIDITHLIPQFDILQGAFTLEQVYKNFPKNTIHVAVIDPGVGSKRQAVLVQTKDYFFIGPDNGIFDFLIKNKEVIAIYHLNKKQFHQNKISSTFHGRDIFASIAGHLANGVSPEKLGTKIKKLQKLKVLSAKFSPTKILGHVISIDSFGNVITNISFDKFKTKTHCKNFILKIHDREIKTVRQTYSDVKIGSAFILKGSHNFLEISMNQKSLAKSWNIQAHDKIEILCKA